MDIVATLQSEWPVISQAPWLFATIAASFLGMGWITGRFLGEERIRILLSRIDHRDDEIKLLKDKIAEFPNSPEKKQVRSALAGFLAECHLLEQQCMSDDGQPPTDKINDWSKRISEYIEANLDDSYKERLKSDAGFMASGIVGPYSDAQKSAMLWLHHRSMRLNEFLSEFSK